MYIYITQRLMGGKTYARKGDTLRPPYGRGLTCCYSHGHTHLFVGIGALLLALGGAGLRWAVGPVLLPLPLGVVGVLARGALGRTWGTMGDRHVSNRVTEPGDISTLKQRTQITVHIGNQLHHTRRHRRHVLPSGDRVSTRVPIENTSPCPLALMCRCH